MCVCVGGGGFFFKKLTKIPKSFFFFCVCGGGGGGGREWGGGVNVFDKESKCEKKIGVDGGGGLGKRANDYSSTN